MPSLEESADGNGSYDAQRMAALLGVHLVSQVLDEACTVVHSTQGIGWFKDKSGRRILSAGLEHQYETAHGDNKVLYNENKENLSHLTTSTPTKEGHLKHKPETSFIGQGDEEIAMLTQEGVAHYSEGIKPDVADVFIANEAQAYSSYIMVVIMNKIYDTTFGINPEHEDKKIDEEESPKSPQQFLEHLCTYREEDGGDDGVIEIVEITEEKTPDDYCNFNIDSACDDYAERDIAFYVEEDAITDLDKVKVEVQAEVHAKIDDDIVIIEETDEDEDEKIDKINAARYENAYLSLNRDYDQCSDEDGDPVLKDPKPMPMQEVELFTASTEDDDTSSCHEPTKEEQRKELAATSAISGASGSRKSRTSLVSRCRTQGARLLSCLRGWWRRKTPFKRKEPRTSGSVRGVCPLSPGARRRASSLLDQRHISSSLPQRSVIWKFNTINEALVNSTKWREYTFEVNDEEFKEHC